MSAISADELGKSLANALDERDRLTEENETLRSEVLQWKAKFDEAVRPSIETRAPKQVLEWIWHMDLHLTEHDERHAGLALRAAWPHVRKYLVEVSERVGVALGREP